MDHDWLETTAPAAPLLKPVEEARRRLIRLGASALSNAELVGMLVGSDDLGRATSMVSGGLKALLAESPESLMEQHHLDDEELARVLAAGELARRLHVTPETRPRLQTPQAIYDWAYKQLIGARREEFHVLCLNTRNYLLRQVRVAEGAVDQCQVDPREALAPAIACRASGIVLLHNHPSGDPEPSAQDVALTRQLREASRLLCIRLLDHVVVSERGFVSLLMRGLIKSESQSYAPQLQSP